jgi:nucleotide-binding universal stress UspA family protein
MSFRRLLVAVDAEPIAARAADVAIYLARSLGAELALIHAIDPSFGYAPESGVPAAELVKLAEEDGKRLLAAFRLRAAVEPPPLEFVPVGKPAAEIVKAAREWPADVIVIGSHGRAGVKRALLGSVAEAVMRHAPCPVLVVRAEE